MLEKKSKYMYMYHTDVVKKFFLLNNTNYMYSVPRLKRINSYYCTSFPKILPPSKTYIHTHTHTCTHTHAHIHTHMWGLGYHIVSE